MKITATGIEASLFIAGLWGRKRKPQRETFTLSRDLRDGDDLQAMVAAKLAEIGAKPGCNWQVHTYDWEEGTYGDDSPTFRTVKLNIGQPATLRGVFDGK